METEAFQMASLLSLRFLSYFLKYNPPHLHFFLKIKGALQKSRAAPSFCCLMSAPFEFLFQDFLKKVLRLRFPQPAFSFLRNRTELPEQARLFPGCFQVLPQEALYLVLLHIFFQKRILFFQKSHRLKLHNR